MSNFEALEYKGWVSSRLDVDLVGHLSEFCCALSVIWIDHEDWFDTYDTSLLIRVAQCTEPLRRIQNIDSVDPCLASLGLFNRGIFMWSCASCFQR